MLDQNFIYILGAGASAGARASYGDAPYSRINRSLAGKNSLDRIEQVIPVVFDMPRRIQLLINDISTWKNGILNEVKNTKINLELQYLTGELTWFKNQLSREPYVDILAETLYATNISSFKRLKNILTIYIMLEQMTNGVDLRYKTFITNLFTLARLNNQIPQFIKFFSWNYDYQFEEALVEKRYLSNINSIKSYITSNFILPQFINNISEYNFVKINGSVNILHTAGGELLNKFDDLIKTSNPFISEQQFNIWEHKNNIIKFCYKLHHSLESNQIETSLKFAWQQERVSDIHLIKSIPDLKNCIAISIGYSFPALNREIDVEILRHISKLYFQCLPTHAEVISERIKGLNPNIKIIPILDISEFYVPNELQQYALELKYRKN